MAMNFESIKSSSSLPRPVIMTDRITGRRISVIADGSYDVPPHGVFHGQRIAEDTWYIYFSKLRPGDTVEIAYRSNEPYGWSPSMDEMMHQPLSIEEIYPNGVALIHPQTGQICIFPLRTVDMSSLGPSRHRKDPVPKMRNGRKDKESGFHAYHYYGNEPRTEGKDEKPCTSYVDGKITYSTPNYVNLSTIGMNSLGDDYLMLKDIFKGKTFFSLEEKYFKEIKLKCPRILGVMLSNHIMIKTIKEENKDVKNKQSSS